MRVVVVGASGGIGSQVAAMVARDGRRLYAIGRDDRRTWLSPADWVVCCNGSHDDAIDANLLRTLECGGWAKGVVTLSGGGVGGPPALDVFADYFAAKAGVAAWTEWMAAKYPSRQFFCVAPGLTATKMTGYKGADPRIPAAFIVKLLSGKYGHLSGSLLAAQRDDLDTMKPMKLRRVECP